MLCLSIPFPSFLARTLFYFVSPSFSLSFFVLFKRIIDVYDLNRPPSSQLTLFSLPCFHHSLKGFLNCNEVSVAKVRTVNTQHGGTSFMSSILCPCYSVIDIPMPKFCYSYQSNHLFNHSRHICIHDRLCQHIPFGTSSNLRHFLNCLSNTAAFFLLI